MIGEPCAGLIQLIGPPVARFVVGVGAVLVAGAEGHQQHGLAGGAHLVRFDEGADRGIVGVDAAMTRRMDRPVVRLVTRAGSK